MKRFSQWFAVFCLIAVASTGMAADPAPVALIDDPVIIGAREIAALTYTLDVTNKDRG